MNFEELKADYEQKMAAKDDWFNGGYRTDVNSGQSYRDTLGFIGDVEQLQEDDGFIIKIDQLGEIDGVKKSVVAVHFYNSANKEIPEYILLN